MLLLVQHAESFLDLLGGDDELMSRVLEKLDTEPVEDLRLDFEDGYGARTDDVEDGHVDGAVEALSTSITDGTAPPYSGIRFKSLERATRARDVRTLVRFVEGLAGMLGLPDGFVVTLPKVTSVDQVEAMVHLVSALERDLASGNRRLRFEIQIETPQSIIGPEGTALVARMIGAADGRCTALHYGTYDYSAYCGIAAGDQSLEHPVADHAKAVMQAAAAGTGIRLSDGSTNVLPVGDNLVGGWKLHHRLVERALHRGFYQGWDLHPAQLPTRFAATFGFYRRGFADAAVRLEAYAGPRSGPVAEEPATARALADFVLRGLDCGALSPCETRDATGLDHSELARLAHQPAPGRLSVGSSRAPPAMAETSTGSECLRRHLPGSAALGRRVGVGDHVAPRPRLTLDAGPGGTMTPVSRRKRASRSARTSLLPLLLVAGASLTACSEPVDRTVIAVLTPDEDASLATGPGSDSFRERIERRCGTCEVRFYSDGTAPDDLARVLDEGADVVVVEALTREQGEDLVAGAGSVPLIAYDRFFAGADYYVSYDRSSMGGLVADAVSRELDTAATALLVNGSATDANADVVERDLRSGLAAGRVEIAAELDPREGTAEETRAWVETQLERAPVDAVVTMGDAQARGVVEALREVGLRRPRWPVVTGIGADLAALRRIIIGDQSLSVHLPAAATAQRAADLALTLASGVARAGVEGTTDHEGVPAFVFDPVVVSRDNLTDVVVRDGTFTTEQLCAGPVAAACERLGIR